MMGRKFIYLILCLLIGLTLQVQAMDGSAKWLDGDRSKKGSMGPVPNEPNEPLGKPFILNFSSLQYNAHNRNFDIVCDSTGRVYVANFEGLLIYDGVQWKTIHTPKITRVNALYKSAAGTIWFGGHNFIGYVQGAYGKEVSYIASDVDEQQHFGEVNHIFERGKNICFSTSEGMAYRIEDRKIIPDKSLTPPVAGHNQVSVPQQNKVITTPANQGLTVSDGKGRVLYSLTTEDGLCSNSINAITYDGKGSLWGATDNGIFVVSSSDVFTHFTEADGLVGQVISIYQHAQQLYVGTLQGLFILQADGRFRKVEGIDQACWQLLDIGGGQILVASADGLFLCGKGVRKLTSRHTLSVLQDRDGTYLTGELDGIYRCTAAGGGTKLLDVTNVIKLEQDTQRGVLATTLYDGCYYRSATAASFSKSKVTPNVLLRYKDWKDVEWSSKKDGKGLIGKGLPKGFEQWLNPFDNYSVQTMYVNGETAWIGGTFGVVRMDLKRCWKSQPFPSVLYIRSLEQDGEDLSLTVSTDKQDVLGGNRYSYRLHNDDRWSRWSTDNRFSFQNLAYGSYELKVRCMDPYGQVAETQEVPFYIPYPLGLRWYAFVLYFMLLLLVVNRFLHWRTQRFRRQRQQLETLVNERTQELKNAQGQLLRQEREAAVGKLTRGLIDRILNPMNYINNFSHLTLGLTRDLHENLEDEAERMTPDNYEDSLDVLDMMKTNLEKIEQHGLSTTRILKAMEEMLKDRQIQLVPTNLSALLQQNVEMLHNYYAQDIHDLPIQVEWERPSEDIQVRAYPDGMSKTVMSMLANSIYAIHRRKEKDLTANYQPLIRITLGVSGDTACLKLYDNGIGIEEKIRASIFDPFFTTKPTGDAPGVGLYLSQLIIQDFGGSITVESEKDNYTEFTITLPIYGRD